MRAVSSEEFRTNLARELREVKKTDRQDAQKKLDEAKQTTPYQIAKGLDRGLHVDITPFNSRELDEEQTANEVQVAPYSNEPSLFETFEYVRHAEGAALGVGLDQMLDFAVNTRLSEVYITDIAAKSVLTTRALLEAGRKFHMLNKRYPSPEEYVALFDFSQIGLLFEMIEPSFTPEELKIVIDVIGKFFKTGPLAMHEYLQYKETQPYYRSWLSTQENLEKIIRMYEDGHLKVVRGDIAGKNAMPQIAKLLRQQGVPLSFLYLSNVSDFFASEERDLPVPEKRMQPIESFLKNIEALPISDQAVVIHISEIKGKNITAPMPELAQKNQNIKLMFAEWTYLIQSISGYRNLMQEISDNPTVNPRKIILQSVQRAQNTLRCDKPGILLLDV